MGYRSCKLLREFLLVLWGLGWRGVQTILIIDSCREDFHSSTPAPPTLFSSQAQRYYYQCPYKTLCVYSLIFVVLRIEPSTLWVLSKYSTHRVTSTAPKITILFPESSTIPLPPLPAPEDLHVNTSFFSPPSTAQMHAYCLSFA